MYIIYITFQNSYTMQSQFIFLDPALKDTVHKKAVQNYFVQPYSISITDLIRSSSVFKLHFYMQLLCSITLYLAYCIVIFARYL